MIAARWVVEGTDGEIVTADPETGLPWTYATAESQVAWAALHGVQITAYQIPAGEVPA